MNVHNKQKLILRFTYQYYWGRNKVYIQSFGWRI